ncbi:MAG: hypothetical protein IJQ13_04495 [Prevotella sp.]|nr:hypothetical protein [Prevotella sp.]
MPAYNLKGEIYDIPDDVVEQFEKENPDATISYSAGGEEYDIPVSKKSGFLEAFPDASVIDPEVPSAPAPVYAPSFTEDNPSPMQPASETPDLAALSDAQQEKAEGFVDNIEEIHQKNAVTPGTAEWRARTVDIPGVNPYNGQTYGQAYDSIIQDFGRNLNHPDIDPSAEARQQIIQAGITDDLKPEEADRLTLQIRNGYANRYAMNCAKDLVAALPDQVPNIDNLMDNLWYTRELQGQIAHEANRFGLSQSDYVNAFVKPQLAKALSDRYGYDVESAKRIANRLFSQKEHTMERIRQNEASAMIGKYAAPLIQDYFDSAKKRADEKFSNISPYTPNGLPSGEALVGDIKRYQETDPAKVWEEMKPGIDDMARAITNDSQFIAEAMDHADEEGIDAKQWIEKRILPVLWPQIQAQFEQMAVEREMPKNTLDYLLANAQKSLVGTLFSVALESQARRRMKNEALQRTEVGLGEYKPSFGARIAGGASAMLPDMALPFGGPFGLIAKGATAPVRGTAQELIAEGMRPLLARITGSSLSGAAILGAFEGTKGAIEGGFTPINQESFLEDNRSAGEILKDVVYGAIEKGIPSAVMGSTMIGGPVGQKISNGRGAIANALGWGTQVGIDAAGATALSTIPKIASGDVNWEDIGNEFASNVGTFAALGLHSKAKEFASLADGGRAWNGVPFSKGEIQVLEDRYLSPFRKQIEEIEKTQNSRGLISERMKGINREEERKAQMESAGMMMYNDLMHSYAVPRELKVKVAQALGVPVPEYALKPNVLGLMDDITNKTVDAGMIDALNFDYNKEGGVADKTKQGQPLNDYELTIRLLFQDNAAYDAALKKQQAGEPLTEQEQELVWTNNARLEQFAKNYKKQEVERIVSIFENEHDMKPGDLKKMLDDVAAGKAVDSNLLNEFERMLGDYDKDLDILIQSRKQQENKVEDTSQEEEIPVESFPVEETPKVNRVAEETPSGEGQAPVSQEQVNGPQPKVNKQTGTIMEAQTIDGRKVYIVDQDQANGLLSLVDENGNPVVMIDKNGYTINRFPSSFLQADEKGQPIIKETKPEGEAKPAETVAENQVVKEKLTTEQPENTPEPQGTALERIPVDEKGEQIWEEAAAEDTAAALSEILESREEALEEAGTEIANLTSQLNELTAPPKGKNKKTSTLNERLKKKEEIRNVQKRLDYWNSVKELLDNEQKTETGQDLDSQHTGGEFAGNGETGQGKIQEQGAEGASGADTQQQEAQGLKTDTGVPFVPDADVSGGTPRVEPEPVPVPTAEQKIAQGTVKNNIGGRFDFRNQDGTRSEVIIKAFKGDNMVEVTRQDYDADGNPKGEPYTQDLNLVDVGNSIINGTLKPVLSTEEKLREAFKGKKGVQNVVDVLTDPERQQLLEAYESGDGEVVSTMLDDFVNSHREDIILNERNKRNSNVNRIMDGTASREEKLRRVRKEYQGYDDAVIALSDEAMQPTTLEEYVADLHSRQPKAGEGPLAYFSYDQDGRKVVGMQDETGHGTKSGGDTKGYAPWLAPKGKGMSLQRYAEQIHSQMPEAIKEQYSDQDVRNAILELFGGAERPSDITTMIIKRGIFQAEQAARRMEEMWIDGSPDYHKVSPDDNTFAGRLTRAKQQTNTEPSDAQKEKGNYKKGHVSFGGYDFVVENPEGSFRRGTDADGKSWEQKMNNTYGYILGKRGKDGDHLDMFINDAQDLDNWNGNVYVIDQVNPKTGDFDEHKIMYGFNTEAEARDAYLSNYEEGWKGLGKITGVDKDTFDKWLDSSDRKIKEFSDHSIIKTAVEKHVPTEAEIDKAIMYEVMKEPAKKGVQFITDVDQGQKILDNFNSSGQMKKMGYKTVKKKGAIAEELEGTELTSEQQAVVNAFTSDNSPVLTVKNNKGKERKIILQQGSDNSVGIKHSLFRHYGTEANNYEAGEILLIPEIIANGKRTQDGKKITYEYEKDGVKYKVTTVMSGKGEKFTNFMTDRKPSEKEQGASNTDEQQAQPVQTVSGAKVQQNAETSKDSGEKMFKTPDGHAYGYTYKGKIYVDPRIATSETPIHEYGHLWAEMKRQSAPEEWDHIKDVLLKDKVVEPFIEKVKRDYPELSGEGKEDDFIEEVLTQFSGKHGAEKLRRMAEEIKQDMGGDATAETIAEAAVRKVKAVLNDFWKGICDMMGWKYTSAEDIADKILSDMLNGVNPREMMKDVSDKMKTQQDVERTLMGVHNISEDKLKKAIKQGGLANPSMAVFDTNKYNHTDYGEISLIPTSSLIDSRTGRNAGTYSGDAWTPTYPNVSKFMTKKGDQHRMEIARQFADGDPELERHLGNVINEWVEGDGDRMHWLFLKQKGLDPEIKPERTTHSHEEFEEIQKIFGDGTNTLPSHGRTPEQDKALLDLMTRGYEEKVREQAKMIPDEDKRNKAIKAMLDSKFGGLVDDQGNLFFAPADNYVYEVWRDEQKRNNPKPDWYATDNEASYRVAKEGLAEEYEKWKQDLLGDEDIEEKLFAGWTPDGDKRYVSNTVQNASRLMNKEAETNAYGNGGFNATRAGLLKKLKTLSEIRKYRHLLKSGEEIKDRHKEMEDKWFDIIQQVSDMQKVDDNRFININIAEARLQEAMQQRDPIGYMNKEYGYDIDKNSELASEWMNFMEEAKQIPVEYFETKFKRPVGLNEFAIAVVPTTTSPEVVKALEDAGLEVRTYERGSIGDENDQNRIQAIKDAVSGRDDILFQKTSQGTDKQGNPVDKDGRLVVEKVDRVDDITDDDFMSPKRSVELPKIPDNVDAALGADGKPVIIKKNIFEKNLRTHDDLSPEASRQILSNALYSTDLYGQTQPKSRPNYWVAIHTADPNSLVVLEIANKKDNVEIVGWRFAGKEQLERLKKQAEREDGQLLILTPDKEAAAGLSALPSGLSDGKDMKNIDTLQENGQEKSSEAPKFQRVSNPEPEMTPEERQYWNKWQADIKKWREANAIPEDAQEPGEETPKQPDEDMMDYVLRIAKHRIDKATWKTAPRLEDYLQKREDKDTVEAARENLQRYPDSIQAKMRMAAAEFQQIRHAMNRQKAYDKATVKAVTDFAQDYMKLGFGDQLSRGDVERMLSSVKNATGAKDIRKEVDNIMNILTDNYLRNLDQRVQKLSSVKDLSKTAQGVEKQGKLELKGQRMIQAFREARQERMSADRIRERMNVVSEYMARNDEEAPMWEQEYEGLNIALQYAENIEGSREEWADLNREYNDAVKDYKANGRTYQQQQEYLDSLEKAMIENKLERIGLFGDIIGRLEGNISESMQGAKEFVEREKQRIANIQKIANFDLAGKDMGAMRVKGSGKPAKLIFSPLGTFEQLMKEFGSRNAKGEGYLYNHFVRGWMDANDKAFEKQEKTHEELDAKAREIFGDSVKRWSDLFTLTRNGFLNKAKNKLKNEEPEFPPMEVTVIDGNEEKKFTLDQGNLLYIYMVNKMNDGAMKLRKMGITEEDVDAIKEHLDPRLVQLGDWLQDEYLPKKRTEYNKVHERMFGAPMAAIDHYFPIKILNDARNQEADVNKAFEQNMLPSTITGSIIKRRRNSLPLDILNTDALSLALEHVDDMDRWSSTAEWKKDLSTLLSYTTFRNKVKNMKTIYGSGDKLWRKFFDLATIAAGEYRPQTGEADKAISNIAKGVTAAKINFRLYTAFKQILSAPAFLHDVNLCYFIKNSVNPKGSYNWAMENMPVFRKRVESRQVGDTRLMDNPDDWKIWKNKIVKGATRGGMWANAKVDAITCAVGARSIYESRLKKYQDMGMDDEAAEKRALQDAEMGYNLTQQSSEGAFVSQIQKDRTVMANMLSVFRNGPMAYTRQEYDAYRNLKHRLKKGFKEESIDFMSKQFQDQLGLSEEQAMEAAKREYNRSGWHEFGKLINMALVTPIFWNLGSSLPYLVYGDDDEWKDIIKNWDKWKNSTKAEMLKDALYKGLAGPIEGLAGGSIISDLVSLGTNEDVRQAFDESIDSGFEQARKNIGKYEINPLPLFADLDKLIGKFGRDRYELTNDLFNIWAQSAVGVNPQTFTDFWNACVDYGIAGKIPVLNKTLNIEDHNQELGKAKEIGIFIMRVMNAPTSSWRNNYIDELKMTPDEAKKLSYDELAKRYVAYKQWKDAPLTTWLRDDESREKKVKAIRKQFKQAVSERMNREFRTMNDDEVENMMMGGNQPKDMFDIIEKEAKRRVEASVEKMDAEELGKAFDADSSTFRRKYEASSLSKMAGASKDPYGDKPDKEWEYQYQLQRTSQDVWEDALLLYYQEKTKARGDNKLADEVSKERGATSGIRKYIKGLKGNENDEEKMNSLRSHRRDLLDKYGIDWKIPQEEQKESSE